MMRPVDDAQHNKRILFENIDDAVGIPGNYAMTCALDRALLAHQRKACKAIRGLEDGAYNAVGARRTALRIVAIDGAQIVAGSL